IFFFSSRRRHTRFSRDWSSDVCSSDLIFCYFYTKSLIMTFPEELKYTKDHEWVKLEGDNALIGITEFAQRELGDIVFVDITTQEIGRASCRERGYSEVGAGALK